jgi:hypothetical protein
MYNSLTRIQNVFGFFTTVAFVVAAFIAASDFTSPRTPSATVKATNVQVYVFGLLNFCPSLPRVDYTACKSTRELSRMPPPSAS